jgi:hypothetical protein
VRGWRKVDGRIRGSASFGYFEIEAMDGLFKALLSGDKEKVASLLRERPIASVLRKFKVMRDKVKDGGEQSRAVLKEWRAGKEARERARKDRKNARERGERHGDPRLERGETLRREYIALLDSGMEAAEAVQTLRAKHKRTKYHAGRLLTPEKVQTTRAKMLLGSLQEAAE